MGDGWEHADLHDHGQPWKLDLRQPSEWWDITHKAPAPDLIVMHHVLHMLDPDDARQALYGLHRLLATGGVLRIGERDLWAGVAAHQRGGQWLHDVVADDVEWTLDGKLLRWLTWHGTVRSLWSPASLIHQLLAVGFADARAVNHGESRAPGGAELDTRPWETFYVEAVA